MSKKHYQEYMDRIGLDEARHQRILAALENEEKEMVEVEGSVLAPVSKTSGRKNIFHWVIRISTAVAMLSLAYLAGSQHFFSSLVSVPQNKESVQMSTNLATNGDKTNSSEFSGSGTISREQMDLAESLEMTLAEEKIDGAHKAVPEDFPQVEASLAEASRRGTSCAEAGRADNALNSYTFVGGEGIPFGVINSGYEWKENYLTIVWDHLAYPLDMEQLSDEQLAQLKDLLSFWGIELAE